MSRRLASNPLPRSTVQTCYVLYQSHACTHRRGSHRARGANAQAVAARAGALCELDRPVEGGPGGDLGIGEVLRLTANFPDPLIRVAPATLHDLDHG